MQLARMSASDVTPSVTLRGDVGLPASRPCLAEREAGPLVRQGRQVGFRYWLLVQCRWLLVTLCGYWMCRAGGATSRGCSAIGTPTRERSNGNDGRN
jgi:hypothetical protein